MKYVACLMLFLVAVTYASTCICTLDYNPVCGSNGVTYQNSCSLLCAKQTDNSITQKHRGECESNRRRRRDICTCPDSHFPVCGSNGKTYANDCELKCEVAQYADLKVDCNGRCPCSP